MERLRDKRRRELDDQIVEAAQRQLALVGGTALSLRAVARDVGVTVSALYRYYGSRDELLTELITRAFRDQADHVIAAGSATDSPAAGLAAAMTAYRSWALSNPASFALVYGTPVPGYSAPPEQTVVQGARIGDYLVGLVSQAWDQGAIAQSAVEQRARTLTDETAEGFRALAARRDYSLPTPLLAATMDTFVRIHGFVVMEVFGQLRPLANDPSEWFTETLRATLSDLGVRT